MQEFSFNADGDFQCKIEMGGGGGKWSVQAAEIDEKTDGLRGHLNVTPEGEDKPTPYLFRIVKKDENVLHMCCPMVFSQDPPRTFDGAGYVKMARGAMGGAAAELEGKSEAAMVMHYLDAIAD